jgi:hypothetical protein
VPASLGLRRVALALVPAGQWPGRSCAAPGPCQCMMLFVETSAYFLAVRLIVNREDPAGLLCLGAPEDEYDPEVADLIKWRQAVTAEQVAAVFLRWFGAAGAMPPDKAARIADGINQAR